MCTRLRRKASKPHLNSPATCDIISVVAKEFNLALL